MKTYFVDSFTTEKFKGNPAAVCIVDGDHPDAETMQSIAAEIGFSETAFVKRTADHSFSIRFFTPKMEIPLCGHATLASSKILFETTSLNHITFENINGVELFIEQCDGKIRMQFPVYETEEVEVPANMLAALGVDAVENQRYSPNNRIILIEIKDAKVLAALQPDFLSLVKSYDGINGVLVTSAAGDAEFDFHYRYFWPWAGTNEDPVTGGVQTFLTKYWAEKLQKNRLNAFQSSARTGSMATELHADKVFIYGEAVIVFEGQLKV